MSGRADDRALAPNVKQRDARAGGRLHHPTGQTLHLAPQSRAAEQTSLESCL